MYETNVIFRSLESLPGHINQDSFDQTLAANVSVTVNEQQVGS